MTIGTFFENSKLFRGNVRCNYLCEQVVGASGEGLDDAFHFELEKEGGELSDGDVGLDADDVQLQVVSLLKQADNLLLLGCEVWEQLAFYGFKLQFLCLPTHAFQEVCRRGDECCRVVANHLVAALAEGHPYGPREGEDVASVFLSNTTGDEPSALNGAFHENGPVRNASHNAVTLTEVVG